MNFDTDILLWINGHYTDWLDTVMWYISHPATWIPIHVVLVVLLVYRYRDWRTVLLVLAAFGIVVGLSDFICSGVLKPWVCRLRPTHEPSITSIHIVRDYTGGMYGFCSSHAANSMAVALLFSLLYRKKTATICLMAWVAVVCYSRMYLGAHYPTDILAGLFIGALCAVSAYLALARWWPRVGDAGVQQVGS
ncbi:MAG: phosphatase PAP2 family protein [Paludibacteraceae bacterium]|nr:phosphatase PAP2 family protein [Paludibacteraceae bacterium]